MEVVADRARPGGRPLSDAMLDRVRTLLAATTADAALADRLRAGCMTEERAERDAASASESQSERPATTPPARPPGHDAEARAGAKRRAELERRIVASTKEVARLRDEAARRAEAAQRADKRAEEARRTLSRSEAEAAAAHEAAAAAEGAAGVAAHELRTLATLLRDAGGRGRRSEGPKGA
jgi:hypothetical protein